ncbi:hypothetical protein H0H92_012552 [Tricholoma furcatifolium]|nr:hypothetical protein H0H92_012552 [Tricholoma furcatifolium]
MSRHSTRNGISFFGMVGGVMAALKLKEHWDQHYNRLSSEEEGRVALNSAPLEPASPYADRDEASIGLLDAEERPVRKRKSGCCVCCGLNCSLFWKAFGIVVLGLFVWNAIKLIIWAVSDAPTGLEHMPAFGSSLGCLAAPYIYNGSKVTFAAQLGSENAHSLDIRGSAVGTFIIAQGAQDQVDVQYEMTLRTADETLLKYIDITYPDFNEDGSVSNSRIIINTPRTGLEAQCMRFDVIMYVPPNMKKLHVVSHAVTQVQFDPNANIELESFYVTLFAMDQNNLLLPSQSVRGDYTAFELIRGWIVGDVAALTSTSITTQRGDGIANVRIHPAPSDPESPSPVTLRTTTGAGRTDVFYIGSTGYKRPIDSIHMSSRNADVYLTYKESEFSGRVDLDSKSFTTSGLQRFQNGPISEGNQKWTHWVGDQDGGDRMSVQSRGWTGLYI